MAHITITQLNTILSRIVTWVTGKFAAKNATSGKLEYEDMPVVVLASMGHELDGTESDRPMSAGDTYFLPAGGGTAARIMYRPDSGNPVKISDPVSDVIYCNAYTGLLYRWDSTTSRMENVGGGGDGLRKVYVESNDYSSLDALHSAEDSGVYQVIDQSLQRSVGILVVSFDDQNGSNPNFVTQWLFSNLTLTQNGDPDSYSGSIDGSHYTIGKAHIIHRFYNASTPVSGNNDIPLNTWSDWKVYGLTLDEISELLNTKANAADIPEKVSDLENDEGYLAAEDFKTINNQSIVGSGNISIPKGDKGDTGNVEFEDLADLVALLVNDLTTGGAGNFLSAEMGKRLRNKIIELESNFQDLLSKLAGMAFVGTKPSYPEIDWSAPKYVVSVDTTGIGHASLQGTWPQQVIEGAEASIVLEGATGYALSSVSYKVGASGETQTAAAVNGVATIKVAVAADVTVYILSTTTTALVQVAAVVKKITGLTSLNTSTNVANYDPVMTMVVDDTTDTEVSNVGWLDDGGKFDGEVTAGAGYGIYKVIVTKGSEDITASVYNPLTHAISIDPVDANVNIEVQVREANNGVFLDTSLHGRKNYNVPADQPFYPEKAGMLVSDTDWCTMVDLAEIPTGATKMRWYFGANCMQSSEISITDSPSWRRTLIHYSNDLVAINYYTIGSTQVITAGYRDRDLDATGTPDKTNSGRTTKYIRASFKTSMLSQSKLQAYVNGAWTDIWTGSEHIPSNS